MMQSVPGMILGVFKPASPPVIPLPETALNNIMQIKSTYILTVPSFIEVISLQICSRAPILVVLISRPLGMGSRSYYAVAAQIDGRIVAWYSKL